MTDINDNNINETTVNAYADAVSSLKQSEEWLEQTRVRVADAERELDQAFARTKEGEEVLAMRELMVESLERRFPGLKAARSEVDGWVGSMRVFDSQAALRAVQQANDE